MSPLDFDGGWIYKDQDAKQAPVLLFDPSVIAGMLASDTIVDGDLQRVGRDDVVADAKRYKIGDKIEIANDAGASRELRVVALANSNSLLGGSFGADASSFVPSSDSQVSHRTYATASGGYDRVSRALPDGEWQTIPEYVEGDLRSVQESQRASVFAMIGGVAVVAFCGMMYSVVGFSVDLACFGFPKTSRNGHSSSVSSIRIDRAYNRWRVGRNGWCWVGSRSIPGCRRVWILRYYLSFRYSLGITLRYLVGIWCFDVDWNDCWAEEVRII